MKYKEKNFVSVVAYVHDAEKTVGKFIASIDEVLREKFLHYEIILANDASCDDSVKVIKEVAATCTNACISILNMSHFQGKELTMNAGQDLAIGDFVYEFDTTVIDYDVSIVFDVYKKSLEGYDVVNVSSNRKRKISSKMFYKVFNKFSNYQYKLDTETFRILSRRAINRVNQINKTVPYRKAVLANCGLKLTRVEYESIADVTTEKNEMMKEEREKNAFDALILFTNVSYKIATALIFAFIFITLCVLGYTVYIFVSSEPIEGWTTTMLFLSFGFLGMFSVLAIIIKYLSVIVGLVFKKTDYLIESIEKLN